MLSLVVSALSSVETVKHDNIFRDQPKNASNKQNAAGRVSFTCVPTMVLVELTVGGFREGGSVANGHSVHRKSLELLLYGQGL